MTREPGRPDGAPAMRLSIVVAAQDARPAIDRCLRTIEAQRPDGIGQVTLVDNSADGTADYVRERFPSVEVVSIPGPALVPRLWAAGARRSREAIVVFTTAELVPEPGWARALLAAYADDRWAGVGGPILPGSGLGLAEQAVYWLRYSGHAAHPPAGEVADIAADNGSYRREILHRRAELLRRDGLWENELNAQLRREGERLYFSADAVVRYRGATRIGRFAVQRLAHGRRFGAWRRRTLRPAHRLLVVGGWPLTPLVFLARIGRNAWRAGGLGSLGRSLPVLLPLLAAWSIGEFVGYIRSARPAPTPGAPPDAAGVPSPRRELDESGG